MTTPVKMQWVPKMALALDVQHGEKDGLILTMINRVSWKDIYWGSDFPYNLQETQRDANFIG